MSIKVIDTINDIMKNLCEPDKWYHIAYSYKKIGKEEFLDSITANQIKEEKK